MSNETLTLQCLVYGGRDPIKHIFPVEIARTKTVGQLKDEIKAKKPAFANIAADDLLLWKAEIDANDTKHFEKELSEYQFNSDDELLPLMRLTVLFLNPPKEDILHILVKAPSSPSE
ncbi:hypothetical protein EW145_g6727 [Phellinidium pouzarii]|uniref:Crinkler effector protein N-terminal domain-containing protein n=1 Tax=Phellinidium pouzarii TaxID=167371 RepID=A0A4S4KW64_9AGAM|nr:hypothetical protein EW145_g6727 [Phellinidium pouzarii]